MTNKGFLLTDILLAAVFLGVIIVTLFPTLSFLLRRNTTTQLSVDANLLVQEGIEIAYNAFADDWDAYPVGTYIRAFDATSQRYILLAGSDESIDAKYTRTIVIDDIRRSTTDGTQDQTGVIDPTSKKITAIVSWKRGTEDMTQQASLLLYEY